jgi:hypothetical protein
LALEGADRPGFKDDPSSFRAVKISGRMILTGAVEAGKIQPAWLASTLTTEE